MGDPMRGEPQQGLGFKVRAQREIHTSSRLNSIKGAIWGAIHGATIGVIQGNTRSLV